MSYELESKKLDQKILRFMASGDGSEKGFERLAMEVFVYQFRWNKSYGKFCEHEKRTPNSVSGWKQIPAMPTAGFKELVLTAFPVSKAKKVFKTSGTTQGRSGAHFFDTLKLYEASIAPTFERSLLPDKAKLEYFYLMMLPSGAPHSSLSYMMGVVNRRYGRSARGRFYVRRDKAEHERLCRDLAKIGPRRPVFMLATAFSLKSFLDHLRDHKRRFCFKPGSRIMETGGFKGRTREISKDALYRLCEKYLGVPRDACVSEYGMTELSSQCYDSRFYDRYKGVKRKSRFVSSPWLRTLAIDPRTMKEAPVGGKGMLRHFDLANRGSVLAVQTEDIGVRLDEGFELLGRSNASELRGCSLAYEEFLRA